MLRNYMELNKYSHSTENKSSNQIKTTNVNILLNRVRLNKKKAFKKKILVSFLAVSLVCFINILLII